MKVKELIAELQKMDPEMEVCRAEGWNNPDFHPLQGVSTVQAIQVGGGYDYPYHEEGETLVTICKI